MMENKDYYIPLIKKTLWEAMSEALDKMDVPDPQPEPKVCKIGDIGYRIDVANSPFMVVSIDTELQYPLLCEYWDGTKIRVSLMAYTSATQSQIDKFMDEKYTVELDEVRCRFYESYNHPNRPNSIDVYIGDGVYGMSNGFLCDGIMKEVLDKAGIRWMTVDERERYQGGKFKCPMEKE